MLPQRPCSLVLLAIVLAVSHAEFSGRKLSKFLQSDTSYEDSEADMASEALHTNDMDAEDDMEAESEDAEADLASADDEGESDDVTAEDDSSDDEDAGPTEIADNEAEWKKENDKFVQQATLSQQAEAQEEAEESSKIEAQLSEARSQLSSAELTHSKPVSLKVNDVTVTSAANQDWKKNVQLDEEDAESGKLAKTDKESRDVEQKAEAKDSSDEESATEDNEVDDAADDNDEDEDDKKPKGSLVAKAAAATVPKAALPVKNSKKVKGAFLQYLDDEDDSEDAGEESEADSSEEDAGSATEEEGYNADAGSEGEETSSSEDEGAKASEDESIHEESHSHEHSTEDEEGGDMEDEDSEHQHRKHKVKEASQGILSEAESNNLVSSAESDIGLNQLVELDGTDSEAESIRRMATARNKDEALEMEMNKNSEGDANGEYEGLEGETFANSVEF